MALRSQGRRNALLLDSPAEGHCCHGKEEIGVGEGKNEGVLWGILLLHMETGALGDNVYHWVLVKCLAQYPVHGK